VNRRTFLLGLGAAACSGTPKAEPPHPRRTGRVGLDAHDHEPTEELVLANVLRTPIALHHDRLVQETRNGELRFWDAIAMTQVGTIELRTHGFCFLSYGALAALVQPRGAKRLEVHLIDANRDVRVLRGPELDTEIDAEVVPGASPTEIYISDADYDIVRLDLRETEARTTARLKVELKPLLTLRQLTSLGDGRLVLRGEAKLSVLEPKKPTVELATTQHPVHVVAASGGRVWYSHTPQLVPPREVSLVRVDSGTLAVDGHVDLSPGEIWHMASGAGALALLVHRERAWSVVVVEESGTERWRVDVPSTFDRGHVAIAEHRVVVVDNATDALIAWDAATGKPIT